MSQFLGTPKPRNPAPAAEIAEVPRLTDTELVQLRIRVIALENRCYRSSHEHPIDNSSLLVRWLPTFFPGQDSPSIL